MSRHQEIFVELFKKSGYTAKQISAWCSVSEATVSRFINGKTDMRAGDFFNLLASLPEDFQDKFWQRFRTTKDDWRSLILNASPKELEEICHLIGDWWAIHRESGEQKKVARQIDSEKVPA